MLAIISSTGDVRTVVSLVMVLLLMPILLPICVFNLALSLTLVITQPTPALKIAPPNSMDKLILGCASIARRHVLPVTIKISAQVVNQMPQWLWITCAIETAIPPINIPTKIVAIKYAHWELMWT